MTKIVVVVPGGEWTYIFFHWLKMSLTSAGTYLETFRLQNVCYCHKGILLDYKEFFGAIILPVSFQDVCDRSFCLCCVFRVTEDEAGQQLSANHSSLQWDAWESGISNSSRLAAGWWQPEGAALWNDGQRRVPRYLSASSHSQGEEKVFQENSWIWQTVWGKSKDSRKCHRWRSLCLSLYWLSFCFNMHLKVWTLNSSSKFL